MKVSLFGNSVNADISIQINEKLKKADKAFCSVAFFTLGGRTDLLDAAAWRAFNNGWICVDLHFPTNLKNMKNIYDQHSVPFFLHLDKIQIGAKKSDYGRSSSVYNVPDGLLHSKLLLIDYPDQSSEVIVGSHNWTINALTGYNIEQSVCIRDKTDSPLIKGFRDILQDIKSKCKFFDTRKLNYFLNLQKEAYGGGVKKFRLDIDSSNLEEELIIFTKGEVKEIKRGQTVWIHTNDGMAIPGELVKSIKNAGANANMPSIQAFEYLGSGSCAPSWDRADVISSINEVFFYHIIRSQDEESIVTAYVPEPVQKKEYWSPKAPEPHYEKVASILGLNPKELTLEALSEEDAMIKHVDYEHWPYTVVKKPQRN
jgi:hypothetical protein